MRKEFIIFFIGIICLIGLIVFTDVDETIINTFQSTSETFRGPIEPAWRQGNAPTVYWKFNETNMFSNATDEMHLFNLTNQAEEASILPGILGNASNFTGAANSHYKNVSNGLLNIHNNNFTIVFWINYSSTDTLSIMGGSSDGTWTNGKGAWLISSQDTPKVIQFVEKDAAGTCKTSADIADDKWHRIVFTRNSTATGGMKVYVDGELNNTCTMNYALRNEHFFLGNAPSDAEFIGLLDDVAIYNGTYWNATDVENDWNSGAGLELDRVDDTINVTFVNPADDKNSTVHELNLSCNSTAKGNLILGNSSILVYDNVGTLVNWSSKHISGINNITNHSIFLPVGDYNWSCVTNATDNINTTHTGNRTLHIHVPELDVTPILSNPNNSYSTGNTSIEFTANFSVNHGNITNGTLYVWNPDNSLFGINESNMSNGVNQTTANITGLAVGTGYQWNFFGCVANATTHVCDFATTNRTFNVEVSADWTFGLLNITETQNQTFLANITIPEATDEINRAYLWYNGTRYLATQSAISSTAYHLSVEIDTPFASTQNSTANTTLEDVPYFWQIVYSGDTPAQNTSTQYQNITPIVLTECNNTYNIGALNFTLRDEEYDFLEINGSFKGTFNYWLGGGDYYKNYSFGNVSSNMSKWEFCISNLENHTLDATLEYSALDRVTRYYYYDDATIYDTDTETNLYLLRLTNSTSFILDAEDENSLPLKEVIIRVQRYYPETGTYELIEMSKTDLDGRGVGHLIEENVDYRFLIEEDGTITLTTAPQKALCISTPCIIYLDKESSLDDIWSIMEGDKNIVYSYSYNQSNKIARFEYVDISGATERVRMMVTVTHLGRVDETPCDTMINSSSGTITCNLSAYSDGQAWVRVYNSKSPFTALFGTTEDIQQFADTFGITGQILGAFIMMGIALVGLFTPIVSVILMPFGLVINKWFGLIEIPPSIVIYFIVLTIVLAIHLIKRK